MSEKVVEIQPIHTACKNCVYAKYEDITQVDCYLDYINKFKDKDLEIIEAYDEDKEFYVINNKKCIGYRDNAWFSSRNLDHLSLTEKIERHFSTNYIKYTLLINLMRFDTIESLKELGRILSTVKVKPSYVIFVRFHGNHVDLHTLENIQDVLTTANFENIKWRIQTMLESNISQDQIVYDCIKLNDKRFISCITNMPNDLDRIVEHADNIVSQNMDSFNIISNNDKSAIIFPVSTYKYCLFQQGKDLLQQDELYTFV